MDQTLYILGTSEGRYVSAASPTSERIRQLIRKDTVFLCFLFCDERFSGSTKRKIVLPSSASNQR
ncbi:hypothetical protein [Arthrobacter sp. JSM 101049]|uniref:hypothetical protein n=1 Tax=Arthrobacter sp. JSM 101049 TaxID=929097 RepID=UPI00356776D0